MPGSQPTKNLEAEHSPKAIRRRLPLIIGALKGRVLGQGMLRSGAETLAVGGGAAVLAYLVGTLIRQLAGIPGL